MVSPKVNFVELYCIFTTAVEFENKYHFIAHRRDHFVFSLCFLNYSSDVITASQIGR